MSKRKFLFICLVFVCVFSLTSCPTRYEKRMAGKFYISKMELSGKYNIDIERAFSDATVILTTGRKFSVNVEFNYEYLDSEETQKMIKDALLDKPTEQQVRDIVDALKEGIYMTGSFSNNNGSMPVFTPDKLSKKPSEYGFHRFDYDFESNTLIIQGNKYVVTRFEFNKI
ncbi:MAG: hypothetical protein LBP62_06995 [Clostridiales bacterium]|nr:hypothetical protein [Clostridiales bacterium]